MKILIVGTSRSGTTSLLNGISKQGYSKFSEPYNPIREKRYPYPPNFLIDNHNICVKSLVGHISKGFDNPIDFHVDMSKHFDKVILLDRRDYHAHWLSYCNLIYKNEVLGVSPHTPWSLKEINETIIQNLINNGWEDRFKKEKVYIKEISNILELEIMYYEDLYSTRKEISTKTIQSMNLMVNEESLMLELDPNKKYLRIGGDII